MDYGCADAFNLCTCQRVGSFSQAKLFVCIECHRRFKRCQKRVERIYRSVHPLTDMVQQSFVQVVPHLPDASPPTIPKYHPPRKPKLPIPTTASMILLLPLPKIRFRLSFICIFYYVYSGHMIYLMATNFIFSISSTATGNPLFNIKVLWLILILAIERDLARQQMSFFSTYTTNKISSTRLSLRRGRRYCTCRDTANREFRAMA